MKMKLTRRMLPIDRNGKHRTKFSHSRSSKFKITLFPIVIMIRVLRRVIIIFVIE